MSTIKKVIIVLVFGVLCAIGGYMYGIHSNESTIEQVREQFNTVKDNQSGITEGVGHAAQSVQKSGAIIDECQQIISRIRQQPAKKN